MQFVFIRVRVWGQSISPRPTLATVKISRSPSLLRFDHKLHKLSCEREFKKLKITQEEGRTGDVCYNL